MSVTSIEWCDRTWNPVRGCSRVSEGCRNCYAERIAGRFSGKGERFDGFARLVSKDPNNDPYRGGTGAARTGFRARWTGRVELIPSKLHEPVRWRKAQKVFVNSMSDLFHESLPDEAIDRVVGVIAWVARHTFQVLTKRPERMRAYSQGLAALTCQQRGVRMVRATGFEVPDDAPGGGMDWPLPNLWLGVSVEDQATADERIPLLLQTPAAKRFVSYEPALGPVDFRPWLHGHEVAGTPFDGAPHVGGCVAYTAPLDWVIVGGESGPGARPFDLGWARFALGQCKAAGVAMFVKQLGGRPVVTRGGRYIGEMDLGDSKGGDPTEWPEDLRMREFPA